MDFSPSTLAALVTAASFAAGLNVYATVLTLGVMARMNWVALPPGLEMLAHTWIIAASAAMFSAEFVADKIPGFDLIWSAAHTAVRVPVAALLAYRATTHLTPGMQLLATAAGAGIAMAAHTSKTAVRTVVTPSPEPLSNIALSSAEDVGAIGLTWAATHHPYAAASVALVLTVLAVLAIRWVTTRLRGLWGRWRGVTGWTQPRPAPAGARLR